ncbi:MAG: amino acid ABC transporter permease [Spirochaetia bacterium]|jgi:polar amino acid transport system permease protein|nr:amino acid ABC transporter permease [Spirochaetia bacterium]
MEKKSLYGSTGLSFRQVGNAFLAGLVVVGIVWFSVLRLSVTFDFSFLGDFRIRIWKGFLMTIALSLVSLVLSLAIGILAALGENSKLLFLKYLSNLYVTFIRGTPLIMQIYLFFYIIGTAWGVDNRFVSGVLILSLFEGAYIAEIIRGGLAGLEETQLEAAKAVGFNRRQTVRFVVIPQLVAMTLPALTGQFSSIIKDSSLLSIIAVIELTQTMREISALNFRLFECYLFLGVLYLCLTLPLAFVSKYFERKFAYEH